MSKQIVSRTIAFEGPHHCGKSTTVSLLNTKVQFADSHMDRAWASTYAFNQVFGRPAMDLDKAIHDYFVNPTAYMVHFSLWLEDYQEDFDAEVSTRAQWCGFIPNIDNQTLDKHICFAIDRAKQLGYSRRILQLKSRQHNAEAQCQQIYNWLSLS